MTSGQRRHPREGAVFFDKSRGRHGKWVAQMPGGMDPDTGLRKRGPKATADTETEARELLKQMVAAEARTGVAGRRDTTVKGVVSDLLANPPAKWRSDITIDTNTTHAERIIAGLGKRKLVALTAGQVEAFLAAMVRDGYSTSTIAATKGVLRLAIRRAERDGLVGRNVADLADTPTGTVRPSHSMDLDQIEKLFAHRLTTWWRTYLTVGILVGLRPGELTGLTWDDIDFDAGVIRVRHCLKAVKGADGRRVLQLEELKTETSRRTLVMPGQAAEALKALHAVQAADKLRLGRYYTDRGIVFCGNAGQPRWRQDVQRGFKKTCKAAGIGADWHPHETRHSFTSVLSDAGVSIEDIADGLGHKDSTVTQQVYRHQIADKVSRTATAMDRIFGKASGS